ncbi:MAG: helix-turn-helix transcriptional regulator [Oscillospiraceae bacterium]|mgnify:CR=1 FL=1
MFYDQLIRICKERNVKPTPLIKSLGLSSGNLKRWQEGATVNSDILMKLADYFDVPVDYFFEEYNKGDIEIDDSAESSMTKVYNVLKSHPDHIASMLSGKMPSNADLLRIAEYLNYSVEYFVRDDEFPDNAKAEDSLLGSIPPKDMILNIMGKLSSGEAFNFLQVRISKIILSNLARKNIHKEKLESILLSKRKLDNLFDNSLNEDKVIGFNFSDLVRISEAFNLSYSYMLTGKD